MMACHGFLDKWAVPRDGRFNGLVSRVSLYFKAQMSGVESREVLISRCKVQWGGHKKVLTNSSLGLKSSLLHSIYTSTPSH
jgi:hypothetical protein